MAAARDHGRLVRVFAAAAGLLLLMAATMAVTTGTASATGGLMQDDFDAMPVPVPTPTSVEVSPGRYVWHSTMGDPTGDPVLFLGGHGEFAHVESSMAALDLLFVVPELTGFGSTPYDPTSTLAGYADDWVALMDTLFPGQDFALVAISTYGSIADHIVARHPDDLTSVHLLSAYDTSGDFTGSINDGICALAVEPDSMVGAIAGLTANPELFIASAGGTDVAASIPGYLDWFVDGLDDYFDPNTGTALGLSQLLWLNCTTAPLDDASLETFARPVFIHHDVNDPAAPFAMAQHHEEVYPNSRTRYYEDGNHLVYMRHAGQVLADIAFHGLFTSVCHDGRSRLVLTPFLAYHLAHGDTRDICAWVGTPAEVTQPA